MTNLYIKKSIVLFAVLLLSSPMFSQSLTTNPCAEPAASEWTIGAGCIATSTAGFTNLFDPASCNSGVFDDGWAWYTGTGAQNTITYTPDPGFDAIIHLFEVPDPAVCSVIELGCSDDLGAGGTETIVGGGVLGTLYYIRIQLVGSNTTMTGCLGIVNNAATCTDGIQNQGELGVDCGGPCVAACPPPTTSSQNSGDDTPCGLSLNTTVDTITCDLVGTAGFNGSVGIVNFTSNNNIDAPSPGPSCGGIGGSGRTDGAWAVYNPINGVSAASLDATEVTGSADINVAFYQGTCGNLTQLGCQTLLLRSGPNFILQPVNVSGINDTEPLYMFIYSSQDYTLTAQLQGFPSTASNDDCASAEQATALGCNVGATPSSFTPPSNYSATICDGGTWYSNENTVYYSFTPDTSDATLQIDNIVCNDGQNGLAQFGVWTSCAAMSLAPSTANGFLGCVVGTSPLTLSNLTAGQTYFIAVDGNAGDLCKWGFEATGGIILLYVDLVSFEAKAQEKIVVLDWETEIEKFAKDFSVQRSVDGIHFEDIYANISKDNFTQFSTIDQNPLPDVSYYRLKIKDIDGDQAYSDVTSVTRASFDKKDKLYIHNIYPQPSKQQLNIDLEVGKASKLNVKIVNTLGQVVLQQSLAVNPQHYNKVSVDLGNLGSGSYSLIIENKDTKEAMLERIQIAK